MNKEELLKEFMNRNIRITEFTDIIGLFATILFPL